MKTFRWYRLIYPIALIPFLLAGCSGGEPFPKETLITATSLVNNLSTGNAKEAHDFLSERMKVKIPPDELAQLWDAQIQELGQFKEISQLQTRSAEDHTIVLLSCEFEHGRTVVTMRVESDGKVDYIEFTTLPDQTGAP